MNVLRDFRRTPARLRSNQPRVVTFALISVATMLFGGGVVAESSSSRAALVLENPSAQIVFDLAGGALGDFHFKESNPQNPPLNPLNWGTPPANDTGIRGFGHFLCLDRWGPPSAAEGAQGMPYHGEAAHVRWELTPPSAPAKSTLESTLRAQLPLAGFAVQRTVRLAESQAVCLVREAVSNQRPLGRLYNMVQHPTIAPPFLDEHTLVDCNGRRGFAQGNPLPHPEEPSFYWPAALNREGQSVNLRHLTDDPDPNVVSYAIDDPIGWVTAANASRGVLIGYVWKTEDYPWVSLWRDVRDRKPAARGLEFGTTGLHQPFPILTQVGRLWNRPIFAYLDAGETQTRSYSVFLLKIPADFQGTESLKVSGGRLLLRERGGAAREFSIQATEDVWP